MHVTAAQPTNLESVPGASATHQQSSALEPSTATESGSNSNTSCKNKKTNAASGKRQQQRQHGNLDDEVRSGRISGFVLLIDLLIKSLLASSRFFFCFFFCCAGGKSTEERSELTEQCRSVRAFPRDDS